MTRQVASSDCGLRRQPPDKKKSILKNVIQDFRLVKSLWHNLSNRKRT
jgi:hypothetical protein